MSVEEYTNRGRRRNRRMDCAKDKSKGINDCDDRWNMEDEKQMYLRKWNKDWKMMISLLYLDC